VDPERREYQRLALTSPLTGRFLKLKIRLLDVSATGALIESDLEIPPGKRGTLTFTWRKHKVKIKAEAVRTTRQAAVTLTSGDVINSNEAVYVVQMLGHFTLTDVSIPQNGTAPTGIALSFDVDVSDGKVVDTGLAHKAADLSSLGPVIVLTL